MIAITTIPAHAQKDTLIDARDNEVYSIVKAGNLWWLAENLRYATEDSYFPNFNKKKETAANGNFYKNDHLAELCPENWRIPTSEEWATAIAEIYQTKKIIRKKITKDKTVAFHFEKETDWDFSVSDLLNIKRYGWVEGNKFNYHGGTTFWLNRKDDPKFHIHFAPDAFSVHSHKHHVEDKPRKQRKFLVRCVCESKPQ